MVESVGEEVGIFDSLVSEFELELLVFDSAEEKVSVGAKLDQGGIVSESLGVLWAAVFHHSEGFLELGVEAFEVGSEGFVDLGFLVEVFAVSLEGSDAGKAFIVVLDDFEVFLQVQEVLTVLSDGHAVLGDLSGGFLSGGQEVEDDLKLGNVI